MFKELLSGRYPEMLEYGVPKRIEPQSFLFHEGSDADICYLVTQGCLKLSKMNEQGREVIIRYISAGGMTATPAVLRGGIYPVSAQAVKPTQVIAWDKAGFLDLTRKYPEIALDLVLMVFRRQEEMLERFLSLGSEQTPLRIAKLMISLMADAGRKNAAGVQIDIPLSRQDIADHIGASMYTVSRIISSWEKSGWLKSSRKKIIITDPGALASFAGN